MNKALLDTDTLSELSKGINLTVTHNGITYRRSHGRYTLTTITVMEIVKGFQKKQDTRRLNAFLTSIALEGILPFDEEKVESRCGAVV